MNKYVLNINKTYCQIYDYSPGKTACLRMLSPKIRGSSDAAGKALCGSTSGKKNKKILELITDDKVNCLGAS